MKNIMFICSGNTCRSPMAEGLFRKYLSDNNIDNINVSSAGVSALRGDSVSINAILALQKRGIDISEHRAKGLNPQKIIETDFFVCMSESHAKVLLRFCDSSKIMVLNVSDPYMQSLDVYDKCAKQIEDAIPEIYEKLKNLSVIRPMSSEHINEIADLEKECFSEPWSEKSLSDELNNPTARFYVLLSDDKVKGYIGANNISDEIYITNVAVNSDSRRNGYGKRLLEHLIVEGLFEKANFITLEVRKSNTPAINLYENKGFKKVGERKNFYKNPQEDGYIYTLYLKDR